MPPELDLEDLRGLTLHQPWLWALLYAGKPVENRKKRPPKKLIGRIFALHAGLDRTARPLSRSSRARATPS